MSNEITKNLVKILNKIPFGRDQTSLNIIQEIPTKAEESRIEFTIGHCGVSGGTEFTIGHCGVSGGTEFTIGHCGV